MREARFEITLVKRGSTWRFDDAARAILDEPLVEGASEMVDARLRRMGLGHSRVAVARFDDRDFDDRAFLIEREPGMLDRGGRWYIDRGTGRAGWLCPVALRFFGDFPEKIYLRFIA